MSLFIQMLFVKSTFKMHQEKMSTFKISTSVLVLLKLVPWKHVFCIFFVFLAKKCKDIKKIPVFYQRSPNVLFVTSFINVYSFIPTQTKPQTLAMTATKTWSPVTSGVQVRISVETRVRGTRSYPPFRSRPTRRMPTES